MSDERRRLTRKYLMVYSRVFSRDTGKIIGYLADLSPRGAMIISDDPLPLDSPQHLRFDLPDPPIFTVDFININARVAWCQPDIDPAFYNIGFEFGTVTSEQLKIIEDMVIAYEFRRDIPKYPGEMGSLS